jgi:diguanylate cyclase
MVIAMIDVDHFKHFNDTEGHLLGDEALKKIAQLFSGNLRKSDSLARYGGEEFVVMMPETKLSSGAEICERLRAAIEAHSFQGQNREGFLTVSIGLCEFPEAGDCTDELINAADKALYEAKQSGRNRVMTGHHVKESSFFIS